MDPQLKAQLAQTINVASESSLGTYADVTWGTAATMSARVEPTARVVETATGERRESTHMIITESEIKVTDRIWLPGDATTDVLAKRPIQVSELVGETGSVEHYETLV